MASSDEPPTFFRKQLTASDIAEQVWIPKNLAHLFTASRFCLDSAGRPQADKIEVHDGRNIFQLSLKRSRSDDTKLCITHSPWSNYAKYRRLKPLDCLILAPLADGCGFALLLRSSSSGHSFDGLPLDVFDQRKIYLSDLLKEHNTTPVPEWLLDRIDGEMISEVVGGMTSDKGKKRRREIAQLDDESKRLRRTKFEKGLARLMATEKTNDASRYHLNRANAKVDASLERVAEARAKLERFIRKIHAKAAKRCRNSSSSSATEVGGAK